MRCFIASIAGCLACASSVDAAEIVLDAGIDSFQVEQPAPAELLGKLGPLLGATGMEELRVAPVSTYSGNADLVDGRGRSVNAKIWLDQFIGGREVRDGFVLIEFNTRTHAVTLLSASFLPDQGLDRECRVTEAQAKVKATTHLRKRIEPLILDGTPAELVYQFERCGEFGGRDGILAWVFGAKRADWADRYQVSVSAISGKVVRVRSWELGCFGPGGWTESPLN